jgi:adenylate kinase
MLNLILFGAPGSGKGTQAPLLVEKYGLIHISTGDLFRYEMQNNTPLGLEAKSYISKGALVPDAVTIGMLRNKVVSHPEAKGFIFDGFPRTVPQAEALDQLLSELNTTIDLLLEMTIEDEIVINRILERGKTSKRADDQDINTIQNRLNGYRQETLPVAEHYGKQQKTHKINGFGEIQDVFDNLCRVIDPVKV